MPWNNALRGFGEDQLNDWCTCISVLFSAILKLGLISPKATVYRGVNQTIRKLPANFIGIFNLLYKTIR